MRKPLIGVTPLYDKERDSYWMLPGYMQGLEAAGALPIMLPLQADPASLLQLTELCDGFLFTGGQDISPFLYGAVKSPACGEVCAARDELETRLFSLCLEQDKPVFGICRGIQFMNAFFGGTLYQNLPTERPTETEHHMQPPYDRIAHQVELVPKSPLAALLQKDTLGVNSYHHQAIRVLAPVLSPMAISEDGLIEAVFLPEKHFVWAVQWHPEFSFRTDESSQKILAAFVRAAAE